jgi:hypothetical protein
MSKEHCFNILQKMFPYLTEDDTSYVKELSEKLRKAQSKDEATLFAVNEFDRLEKLQKEKMRNRLLSVQSKNNVISTLKEIQEKGKGFNYDEKKAMISFLVGDNNHVNKLSVATAQTTASEQAISNLYRDLESNFGNEIEILHGNAFNDLRGIKDAGAIKLDNDIRIELGELNKSENSNAGRSGNKQALEMAKVIKKHLDTSIGDYKQSGGIIDQLEGWAGKQKHNRNALTEAGFEKWHDDVSKILDVEKTYKGKIKEGSLIKDNNGLLDSVVIIDNETKVGRNLTKESIKKDLFEIYNNILDGKIYHAWGEETGKKKPFGVGVAARLGKSRFLQFKDVESEIFYNNRYNNGENILFQAQSLVQRFRRDEVILRKFGPEPFEVLKEVENHFKELGRQEGKKIDVGFEIRGNQIVDNTSFKVGINGLQSSAVALKQILESGVAFGENSLKLANICSNIRKFKTTTSLGGIVITSFPDAVSIGVKSILRGEASIGKAIGDIMQSTILNFKTLLHPAKAVVGMGKAEREEAMALARSYGFGIHSLLSDISSHLNESTDKNIVDKINRVFWKLNLEEMRTNMQEALIARTFSSRLAEDASKSFKELNEFRQTFFKTYGIDSQRWDLMREKMLINFDGKDKEQFGKMILPDLIENITDAELKSIAKPDILANGKITQRSLDNARKELKEQITMMYRDSVDSALIKQSARTRAGLTMGTKAGTVSGEFFRFNTQFLSYTAEYTGQILQQIWTHPNITKQGKLGAYVGLGATGIVFSYLGFAIKDILAGKEPRAINETTMIEAFRQSGITGVYGEYAGRLLQATGKNNPMMSQNVIDRNVINSLFGPSLSSVYDIGKTVFSDISASAEAGKFKGNLDRYKMIAKAQIPGQNLFYMQPIINAMMVNVVLSDKEVKRQKKYMKKNYDQKFIFNK